MTAQMTFWHVVDMTNEDDELIGYGVCVETVAEGGQHSYEMKPDVFPVRSEAHAYVARASGRELRS